MSFRVGWLAGRRRYAAVDDRGGLPGRFSRAARCRRLKIGSSSALRRRGGDRNARRTMTSRRRGDVTGNCRRPAERRQQQRQRRRTPRRDWLRPAAVARTSRRLDDVTMTSRRRGDVTRNSCRPSGDGSSSSSSGGGERHGATDSLALASRSLVAACTLRGREPAGIRRTAYS